MSMSGQTDFLKLGTYMSGDKLSYLGGFNTNMQKIDTFAEDTATALSTLNSGDEQTKQALQSLNNRMSDTETNIVGINDNVKNLRLGQNTHTESIRNLQNGQESLESDITSLRTEDDSLDARVTALEDGGTATLPMCCKAFIEHSGSGLSTVSFPNMGITNDNLNNYNLYYTIYAIVPLTPSSSTSTLTSAVLATGFKPLNHNGFRLSEVNQQMFLTPVYNFNEQQQQLYMLKTINRLEASAYNISSRNMTLTGELGLFYTALNYGADKEPATFGGISSELSRVKLQCHFEICKNHYH